MNTDPKQYYEVVPLSSGELSDETHNDKIVTFIDEDGYHATIYYTVKHGQFFSKPYVSFLRPVSLTTIIKDAASKELFPCRHCDKEFTDEYELDAHVNFNHNQLTK